MHVSMYICTNLFMHAYMCTRRAAASARRKTVIHDDERVS